MKSKFLFTAALAAMAFTSCQKDVTEQGSAQTGQDTYIGMTIQLPKSVVSRAGFQGDDNATEAESKLTYVTVGTWSDGDNAVTYTELNVDELRNNLDGTYTATKAVKAKTGMNNVIVLANSGFKPSIQQINGAAFDAAVAEIATDSKFVMYSNEVTKMHDVAFASKDEVENAATGSPLLTSNKTEVTLRRAAAKVAITSSLGETVTGVADGLGNGKLTNIAWNIANQNSQMTVFPKYVTAIDFIASNVNSPFERLDPTLIPAATALPKDGAAASVAYCLENAHGTDVYKENNTTAVQVSATFAPDAQRYVSNINSIAKVDVILGNVDMTAGTTFFVSRRELGQNVAGMANIVAGTYFTEGAVDNAVTIFGVNKEADFVKYENGKCFWAIWINDGDTTKPNYGVLRNHMYTMNIKSIKAPGFPSFPDTDNPIAADTWIMVDLNVEQWNAKGMGDIDL